MRHWSSIMCHTIEGTGCVLGGKREGDLFQTNDDVFLLLLITTHICTVGEG